MAIAALVISLIALTAIPVAVASAIYARTSARSAAAQVHDARTPVWTPAFRSEGIGGGVLTLHLASNHPLTRIAATIVDSDGISFSTSQTGVDPSLPSPVLTAEAGPLSPAEPATWRLTFELRRVAKLRLRVHSVGDTNETWNTPVELTIPYSPSAY